MVKKILASLIILASGVIVISFFLPWARVSVSTMGISKELSGIQKKLQGTPLAGKVVEKLGVVTTGISEFGDISIKTTVPGYRIPGMVNSKTSKVALSAVQIMTRSASGLEAKSYLVYLLPLLGIACGILAVLGLEKRIYIIIILAIGGIVGIKGLHNLSTAKLANVAVKVDIMSGLWNTMYAFLFIFLVGIAWLVMDKKA